MVNHLDDGVHEAQVAGVDETPRLQMQQRRHQLAGVVPGGTQVTCHSVEATQAELVGIQEVVPLFPWSCEACQ